MTETTSRQSLLLISIALSGAAFLDSLAWAQTSPTNQEPVIPPFPLDQPAPLPELPQAPEDPFQFNQDTPPEGSPDAEDVPAVSFFVEEIQVLGNTLFNSEIEALVSPLENRDITLADLLDLRTAITELYVNNGYITSGAFIPTNQDLTAGVVQIQVVEGEVEQLQVNGLSRLREGYVRDRINRVTDAPLNIRRLEEGLQILQIDPLLNRVNAELTAGSGPGRNLLILDLEEADPFIGTLGADNYRAPSIGSSQGGASITHLNLLGFGDRLGASYSWTDGLDLYEVRYGIPLNGLDGTLTLRYENAESRIVDPRFIDIGIRSESETFAMGFRQPLNRSLTNEVALGLGFDLRESRSFIRNTEPFSFSVGPENGVARVSSIRFFQEWVNRDLNRVIAARSQFSLGLDWFGATVNDTGTDGRYFSWLGQFQWVEQLPAETLWITRFNTQLTPDSLLPIERFSIGGVGTVRGYAQNRIVADNAITASTEFRFALADNLQIGPFLDAGGGWNNQGPDPNPAFLLGTGLLLQWQPIDEFSLRLDYGIPLVNTTGRGNSLQENGVYFSITSRPF